MTVTVAEQTYVFFYCILSGILIGIAFDIFRIIRRVHHSNELSTFIQDLIFWIISSIIAFLFMLKFNQGEVRWYMFLGVFLGAFIYYVSISSFVIAFFVAAITFIKKILAFAIKLILAPFKFIIKLIKKPFILVLNISRRGFMQIRYKLLRNFSFFSKIIKKI